MRATKAVSVTFAVLLLAGCGKSAGPSAKATSFEQALGMDEASQKAREAKVQDAIRDCMKAEGFEYIPVDPSQSNMKVAFGGPGGDNADPKFRKTKGYGITTTFGEKFFSGGGPRDQDTDPNEKIRLALSAEDRKAYDIALHGESAAKDEDDGGTGSKPRAGVVINRREVGTGDSGLSDQGCFGKAEEKVPGGPEQFKSGLEEVEQRVKSDPRLIQADGDWARCMATAGFTTFDKPDDIPPYLFGKLQALTNSSEGEIRFDPSMIDQAALGAIQHEEISLANKDYACRKSTGEAKIAEEVRQAAEQRFLDEHPNLTAGK